LDTNRTLCGSGIKRCKSVSTSKSYTDVTHRKLV
jgi:hypothetical protein